MYFLVFALGLYTRDLGKWKPIQWVEIGRLGAVRSRLLNISFHTALNFNHWIYYLNNLL